MSDSIETKGKTVNDAVSEALLQLGLRRDEVEIKVIEEPKSGLLGFIGGRPAKVKVRKKPERSRGRGRNNRHRDDQAHSLSGGGRGRGGRGRGGRNNQRDDQQRDNKQGGRGRGRGDRADQGERSDNNEVRAESREESRRDSQGGGRGRSRGRRGGRGNRQDNRQEGRRDSQRQDSQSQGSQSERSQRQDNQRQDNQRQDNQRQDNKQAAEGRSSSRGGGNRRGGRGRGRGGRDDQQVTVERAAEKTSRSRRGGRSDQKQEAQRNEPVAARDNNAAAEVVSRPAPVKESPRESSRETSSETPNAAAAVVSSTPINSENTKMTNEKPQPTPAAVDATPVEPVAKPKAKRKGWGGGLGARLPRRDNPAVKAKPEPKVIAEAAPVAPTPSPAPRRESRQESRTESRGRDDYRGRRSDAAADEVIVGGIAATKYAKAVQNVNDETLDAALGELAAGMLARAGFPCEVAVGEGEYRQVRISSDEESAGMLIGRHGQTVDAVEHLVERMACNAVDDRVRMNLDINGYRERRSESLRERVAEAVAEVRETGRSYHVEPMSARERRLVHLEAEPVEGIRTYTNVGSGGKYVVIALDNEATDDERNGD